MSQSEIFNNNKGEFFVFESESESASASEDESDCEDYGDLNFSDNRPNKSFPKKSESTSFTLQNAINKKEKLTAAFNVVDNLDIAKKDESLENKKIVKKSVNDRILESLKNFEHIVSNNLIDESKKSVFVDYLNMMLIIGIDSKKVPSDYKSKMNKLLDELMKDSKKKFEWLFTKDIKFTLTKIPASKYAKHDMEYDGNIEIESSDKKSESFYDNTYLKGAGIILYKIKKETIGRRMTIHDIEILMIQSESNCWGFPKGKLEEGEDFRKCALREFNEETGYELDNSLINDETKYITVNDRKNGIVTKSVRYYIIEVEEDFKIDTFPSESNNETTGMAWFKDSEIIFSIEKLNREVINCQIDKYPFTNRRVIQPKKSDYNLSSTTNDVIKIFSLVLRKSDSSVYNLSKSQIRELNKKTYLSSQSKYVLINFYKILVNEKINYNLKMKIRQKLKESSTKNYKKIY